jgi:hypothetical protein
MSVQGPDAQEGSGAKVCAFVYPLAPPLLEILRLCSGTHAERDPDK